MKLRLAAAMLVLSASTALAADLTYEPAPIAAPAEAFNWTGFYIGVHGGYGWGHTQDTHNPNAFGQTLTGGFGGAQIGYNYQFANNVVLGAEADVAYSGIGKDWGGATQYDPYYGEDKIDWFGTVRARVGYSVDRFMPYLTGGLAWANVDHKLGCDPSRSPLTPRGCSRVGSFETSKSDTAWGWTVGAGVEYAVTNNVTVKAEYLYTDLGKNDVTLVDVNFPTDPVNNREFDTSFNSVKLGLNYKF
ncbi:MAG: porin family protein [Candidatus Kaistia colombiensis]|nr:MAG: porin family protein [Kaistia sp.]